MRVPAVVPSLLKINKLTANGETSPERQESTPQYHLRTTSLLAPNDCQRMIVFLASRNTCQVLSMRVRKSAMLEIAGTTILAMMAEEAVHVHTCIFLGTRQ